MINLDIIMDNKMEVLMINSSIRIIMHSSTISIIKDTTSSTQDRPNSLLLKESSPSQKWHLQTVCNQTWPRLISSNKQLQQVNNTTMITLNTMLIPLTINITTANNSPELKHPLTLLTISITMVPTLSNSRSHHSKKDLVKAPSSINQKSPLMMGQVLRLQSLTNEINDCEVGIRVKRMRMEKIGTARGQDVDHLGTQAKRSSSI
jgi:hypothetical protein